MSFQFDTLMDFIIMGGHGSFVWSSYVITTLSLLVLVIIPPIQKRQLMSQLKRRQRIEELTIENPRE